VGEGVFWEVKVPFQYVLKKHVKLTRKDYMLHILDLNNGVKNDQHIKVAQNQGCEDEHIGALTGKQEKCLNFSNKYVEGAKLIFI
jgi:hypothetical protein